MIPGFPERLRAALPAGVREIAAALATAGRRAYLVGGSIRDLLIGRAVTDWDLATDAHPEEVVRLFARTIPTGIAHGTVTVLPPAGGAFEVTTLRREWGYTDARRPDGVAFVADVREDLARRDFTVNAIAADLATGEIIDPAAGIGDLESRTLKAVGDARARFLEDALRPLRAARFVSQLEFELEPATRAAMALPEVHERFALLAQERIRDEILKLLASPRPSTAIEILREAGLLALFLPELDVCHGEPQNEYHRYDVYDHTLAVIDAAPSEKPVVRLAALFHDLAKPGTREEHGTKVTFYGHQTAGAEIAERALTRLRFPNELRDRVVHLVREHMFDYHPVWSDAAVRRFVRRIGPDAIADLFDLRIADVMGKGKGGYPVGLEHVRRRIESVLARRDALSVRDLAADGTDVMRVGEMPAGPGVGRVLERLLERVLADPSLNNREILLELIPALAEEETGGPPALRPDTSG